MVAGFVGLLWFFYPRQEVFSTDHPMYVVGLSVSEARAKLGEPQSAVMGDCVLIHNDTSHLVGTHWHYLFLDSTQRVEVNLCVYNETVFSQRIESQTKRGGLVTTLTADWVSSFLLNGVEKDEFGVNL